MNNISHIFELLTIKITVVNFLNSIAKMGFRISNLEKNKNKINKQLLLEIERVLPEMNQIGLSNCIWFINNKINILIVEIYLY